MSRIMPLSIHPARSTARRLAIVMLALTPIACSDTPKNDAAGGTGGLSGTLYVEVGTGTSTFKLDFASGAVAKLGTGAGPTVAPDGKLLLDDGNDIFETDETFAQHRVILHFDSDLEKSNNGFHDHQVSCDGTKIVYTTNDDNMYVANRTDGAVVARLEKKGVTEAWERPTWTPDDRIVAAGGFANPGLFISDAGHTTMTRFDPDLARPTKPCVSPDGTKVAFILNDRVHVINIDGTGFIRLDPSDDEDTYPTWSPDGSKIAYRVSGRIKVMASTGGASTDLDDVFPEVPQKYFIFSGYQFAWK
jgi:Tol biopolymer transport system component